MEVDKEILDILACPACRGDVGLQENKIVCQNRKARFNYFILDKFEAGMVLVGTEVKSLRAGQGNLKDSYANIKNGEIYLYKMHISPYSFAARGNHDPDRPQGERGKPSRLADRRDVRAPAHQGQQQHEATDPDAGREHVDPLQRLGGPGGARRGRMPAQHPDQHRAAGRHGHDPQHPPDAERDQGPDQDRGHQDEEHPEPTSRG